MLGSGRRNLRADAQLHAIGLEQENIEQVEIAHTGAVTTPGVGAGADGQGGTQQLRYADKVVRGDGQGAAQQGVVGVDIAVVDPGRVVVLQVQARGQAQGVVTFVGYIGIVCQGSSDRGQGQGQ